MLAPEAGGAADGAADLLHLDVMDGHFVPNLTMGPDLCRWLRREFPDAMLDVHLMVTDPEQCVGPFRDAGADHLTFHIEPADPAYRAPSGAGGGRSGAGYEPVEVAEQVRAAGMTAGLAINPPTPPTRFLELAPHFDLLLVMSVNPGFSGQSFIEASLETLGAVRRQVGRGKRVQVDGGVRPGNADLARDAGCDVLVAASAIFGTSRGDRPGVIASIRGEL